VSAEPHVLGPKKLRLTEPETPKSSELHRIDAATQLGLELPFLQLFFQTLPFMTLKQIGALCSQSNLMIYVVVCL
jgi:hypothetical protein